MPIQDREQKNRQRRRRNRGNQQAATWSAVHPQAVTQFMFELTEAGYAVRFGKSRDGGALAIGIYGDGDPYTEYVRPSDNALALLDEIALDLLGRDIGLENLVEEG